MMTSDAIEGDATDTMAAVARLLMRHTSAAHTAMTADSPSGPLGVATIHH